MESPYKIWPFYFSPPFRQKGGQKKFGFHLVDNRCRRWRVKCFGGEKRLARIALIEAMLFKRVRLVQRLYEIKKKVYVIGIYGVGDI